MPGKLTDNEVEWLKNFALERGPGRRVLHLRTGVALFSKGDEVSAIYLVLRGQIKVVATNGGKTVVHEVVGRHHWLASEAIDGMHIHIHSANATSETELLAFEQTSFQQIIDEHPILRAIFMRAMASHLYAKGVALDDVLFNSAPTRLALALLELFKGKDAIVIDLKTTQIRLAEMIGTTRQTVNGIVNAFSAAGILKVSGRSSYRLFKVPLEKFLDDEGKK
jgi:CRP-like cAMP-binding protein